MRLAGLLFSAELDLVVWLVAVADFFLCLDVVVAPEANETIPASRETAATKPFNLPQLLNRTSPEKNFYFHFKPHAGPME
ncbi:hypothetical protein [Edaphobacter acidisoli]|uniref:hypothetical protein n=1 Tax=Edaphobacter acidisoli TaxID=2040573 RepID=UPI001669222A|nr:hypothetical protein [Edaphobacter acidisoli]